MRKLNASDLFNAGRLIKNSGVKEEVMKIYNHAESNTAEGAGVEFIFTVLEVATKAGIEMELYKFFGNITEKSPEEFRDQDLAITFAELEQINQENDLKHFFDVLAKLVR